MNKRSKITLIMVAAACLFLGKAAAELKPDYKKGLDQLGDSLLVDLATTGGGDSMTEGYVWWVAETRDLWSSGERVTLTGIALPIHAETAAPNVLTFTFYDLGDNSAFDPDDVVVGRVKESYYGGETGVWYAKFEEPVTFIAKGTGVAVGFGGAKGPIRLKVASEQSAPGILRVKRNDGEAVGTEFPHFAMSLAGVAVKATP